VRKAIVAGIIGVGLLAGCGSEQDQARQRQMSKDYVEVTSKGEYLNETYDGIARMPASIFRYDGRLWICSNIYTSCYPKY
jgi:hypothetical protein